MKKSVKIYVICAYKHDKFIGYIKNYRLHNNNKYRFNKTKNINNTKKYFSLTDGTTIKNKILFNIDKLYYSDILLKITTLSKKEIRKSKLKYLELIITKKGLFKNK